MENAPKQTNKNSEDVLRIISQLKTEIIERKWAEKKARDALDYSESIIDSVKHPLIVLDEYKKVISVNLAFYDLFTLTPGIVLGQNFFSITDGMFDFKEMRTLLDGKIPSEGRSCEISREFNLIGKKYLRLAVQGLQYNIKHLRFTFLTIEDVSEQKTAELRLRKALEDKSILVKEVHHRVKNNLQILSSLLSLQISTVDDAGQQKVLEDGRSRVLAISAVHESLSVNGSAEEIPISEPVLRLINSLESIFDEDIAIYTNICEASLSINQATLLCLILNEIITNAYKHAFTDCSNPEKKITVDISMENASLLVRIADNGCGLGLHEENENKMNFTNSLGFILVRNLVENQLKGSWTFHDYEGLVHEIRFSLFESEEVLQDIYTGL